MNSLAVLPEEVRQLIIQQIDAQSRAALGWSAVVSIAVALFSASGGVNNLMAAVSTAYDEEEQRSAIKR